MSHTAVIEQMLGAIEAVIEQVDCQDRWCPVCCSRLDSVHRGWCWWPGLVEAAAAGRKHLKGRHRREKERNARHG